MPEPQNMTVHKAEGFPFRHMPHFAYILGVIPYRRLTARERLNELLLAQAERNLRDGSDNEALEKLSVSLGSALDVPARDPLDWARILATLIMVAALFYIVYEVGLQGAGATPGATQLVSLASGLAGIGLGWLFGTGSARGKNDK